MSSRLPERVDPWRLADQAETLVGTFPLGEMPRLAPLLADSGGEVRFTLFFGRDADRRAVIRGEVAAELPLLCQRCLAAFGLSVESRVMLAVVTGPDEANALPEQYEALLAEEATVRLRDIVEEELLLSVPAVPRHDDTGCSRAESGPRQAGDTTSSSKPFDVLAGLRGRPDKD
jgi:uncharacterized protein